MSESKALASTPKEWEWKPAASLRAHSPAESANDQRIKKSESIAVLFVS